MDLLLQPSYTEGFNMVTADGIAQGVASVVSDAIAWAPKNWQAETDDAIDIANKAVGLLHDPGAVDDDDAIDGGIDHGMEPGVVLNPATRVDFLYDVLPMLHHVLIMSVNPGFGGQKFIPFSLDKIRRLHELRAERNLSFRIEVDGGVAHDTVAAVVEAGAELLVAGSAVFDGGQPERKARELLEAARSAELASAR